MVVDERRLRRGRDRGTGTTVLPAAVLSGSQYFAAYQTTAVRETLQLSRRPWWPRPVSVCDGEVRRLIHVRAA
jgi:hypothetical protein